MKPAIPPAPFRQFPRLLCEKAEAKASGLYRNATWDLVDRSAEAGFDLEKVRAEDLPEEMRAMDLEAKKAHLAKKRAEREAIQAKIRDLGEKRRAHVKEEMSKRGLDDSKALDRAVRDGRHRQHERSGMAVHGIAQAPVELGRARPGGRVHRELAVRQPVGQLAQVVLDPPGPGWEVVGDQQRARHRADRLDRRRPLRWRCPVRAGPAAARAA